MPTPTRARRHAPADTRPPTRARRHAPAFSAVSPLRSLLLIALLCLSAFTLGVTPARAGYYSVAASGGSWTDGNGDHPDAQVGTQNGCDYLTGNGVSSAQGAVTVTCTWVPDPGQTLATDPPPQCVLVDEEGYAYYEASGHDFDGGSCDDGLGDAAVPWDVDIACLTSGSPQLDNVHYHVHGGGPKFTWTRSPSVTPGSDGGVCGDLIYSFGVQGFNFPPLVLSLNSPPYYLIPPGSPDAVLLGAPVLVTTVPFDPSDPFGPDGTVDQSGVLGTMSGLPGFFPGTVQNGLAGDMTQGLQTSLVNAGLVLMTDGLGNVVGEVLDLGAATGGGGYPAVIGRFTDVEPFYADPTYNTLNIEDWTPEKNAQWIANAYNSGQDIILQTPIDEFGLGQGRWTLQELYVLLTMPDGGIEVNDLIQQLERQSGFNFGDVF